MNTSQEVVSEIVGLPAMATPTVSEQVPAGDAAVDPAVIPGNDHQSPYGTRKRQISVLIPQYDTVRSDTKQKPPSSSRKRKNPRRYSHDASLSGRAHSNRHASFGHEFMLMDNSSHGLHAGSSLQKNMPAQLCHRILNGLLVHGHLPLQSIISLLPDQGSASAQRDQTIGILEVLEVLGIVKCIRIMEESPDGEPPVMGEAGIASPASAVSEKRRLDAVSHEEAQNEAQVKLQSLQQLQQQHYILTQKQQEDLNKAQRLRVHQINEVLESIRTLEKVKADAEADESARVNHLKQLQEWLVTANSQKEAAQKQIKQYAAQTRAQADIYHQQIAECHAILGTTNQTMRDGSHQTLSAKHSPDCYYVISGFAKGGSEISSLAGPRFESSIAAKRKNAEDIRDRVDQLIKLSSTISEPSHSVTGSYSLRQKRKQSAKVNDSGSDSGPNSTDDGGFNADSSKSSDEDRETTRSSGGGSGGGGRSLKSSGLKTKSDRLSKLKALVASFTAKDTTLLDDPLYRSLEDSGLGMLNGARTR